MAIVSWYEELDRQLSNSEIPLIGLLNQRYPQPWMVPFFGQVTESTVLMVGLNPSYGEFSGSRSHEDIKPCRWPESLSGMPHPAGIAAR
mgnify:CR=1 FL=1